jgi:5-formyltetrahydrofolate cyclo-ligase
MSTLRDEKRLLRREVWDDLRALRHARFPGARGRVPNFLGAEAAARALALDPRFRRARALACNPDLAQRTVRLLALREGKRVYLAQPRLAGRRAFVLLDPAQLDPSDLWRLSGIGAALEAGRPVDVAEVEPLDLCVVGCVAVGKDGARLGKGGGGSDLEYAVLRAAGCLTARTPVLTTAHPVQVRPAGRVPMDPHDLAVDGAALPDGFAELRRTCRRPRGLCADLLDEEQLARSPTLRRVSASG